MAFGIEIAAVATAVALSLSLRPTGGVLRLTVVLWGISAFGLAHMFVEHSIMVSFSDASWDSPPGTGYGTVVLLLVAGLVALTGAIRRRGPSEGAGSEDGLVENVTSSDSSDRPTRGGTAMSATK